MRKLSMALFLTVFQMITVYSIAQSVEVGYVKEYQGEEQKTPLSGVELRVVGAQSTVSDKNGRYELQFSVLKPGERIEYNDIYKQGYVIFNKEALEYWRISKDQSPFVIVMCKESVFRQLKMKYYDIIGNSYNEDYVRRLEDAQKKYAADIGKLDEEKKRIEYDYKEKLRNIDNYAELFARIDYSEMDSVEAKALRLIEEGKIDEGIAAYEELHLVQQTEMQLDKWKSGENMRVVGERMKDEAQKDMLALVEKLKKQIALYEIGGLSYDTKQKEMILHLVDVYGELNGMMDGEFSEEMGQWLVKLANDSKDLESMEKYFRRAANVPSAIGLYSFIIYWYQLLIDGNEHYLDSAEFYTNKALALQQTWNDSVRAEFDNMQKWTSDFSEQISSGDTLFFKIMDDANSVSVWLKSRFFSNDVKGVIRIPETVLHEGKTYVVSSIGPYSFYNNRKIRKVITPGSITAIDVRAFDKCYAMDTIVISKSVQYIGYSAIPFSTTIVMPDDLSNATWLGDVVPYMIDTMWKDSALLYKCHELQTMLNSAKQNRSINADVKPYLDYWMGQLCLINHDPAGAINHYQEASKYKEWGKELYYAIGSLYYLQKDFKQAYKYYIQTADEQHLWVYNQLAYMYAKGEYVKQSFDEALKYIDLAISNAPNYESLANYYDTKGEIFLMMGEIDKAEECWNNVIQIYPSFNVEVSELYLKLKELHGNETELGTDDYMNEAVTMQDSIQQNSAQSHSQYKVSSYIRMVELVALSEYNYLDFTNASLFFVEYEELLSIGIIAIQALIQSKTPEELDRYELSYIAAAVRMAIRNELKLRYSWYKIYNIDSNDLDGIGEIQEKDMKRCLIRATLYNTIHDLGELLLRIDNGEELPLMCTIAKHRFDFLLYQTKDSEFDEEIASSWSAIKEAIIGLSTKKQRIANGIIRDGYSINKTMELYDVTIEECFEVLDEINQHLKNKGKKG